MEFLAHGTDGTGGNFKEAVHLCLSTLPGVKVSSCQTASLVALASFFSPLLLHFFPLQELHD